ncbi:uncharacterized protein [Nicotiana sylvestris]|uniref:uncharacterized protein n=1 Tax=Nicotiana sylvestris TaxID=4096 RepID=UPI00388C5151
MSAPPGNWEGQFTARPPLFNDQYYSWWKNRMRDHIIGEDYELWDIVTDGLLATTKKNDEGVDVPKTRADYTAEDLKKWEKNAKAKKWLVWGLGPDEYNRIQSCTTAKEIWDTLQVAHEGTPQVKRSRATLLYSQYENFTMKEGETIEEMYTRFIILTTKLKSLGRIILEEDKVEKILTRVLPANHKDGLPKKERSLALRIAEGSDLEDNEMAMITRDFKKYLIRGKGSSRGETFNKPRAPKKQTNEGCYKCGKTNHMIKNCLQLEIEWKKKRAERSNSSDEDSEDEAGDEQTLMAIGESDDEQDISVIHLKDKIKFLSKEKLSKLLLDFIDESEVINN